MQLLSTELDQNLSTLFYKRPSSSISLLEESVTEISLLDCIRQSEKESSIFVKSLKDIELLGHFYVFNNLIEVKRFLLANPNLINPIFEAYKQIKKIFGQSIVEVVLEYDRDSEEDFEGICAIVKTSLSPELSLGLLDKFDQEWWLDVDSGTRTILTVMVRPV